MFSSLSLLAVLMLGGAPSMFAQAETATSLVNVVARYSGQTCYFDSGSQTIDFGTVNATSFDSAGATPSETVQALSLKFYCQDVGLGTVIGFEAIADGFDSSLVKNSGSATGVGVVLNYASSGSKVLNNPHLTWAISSNWTTIDLTTALRRTSAAFQGGTVSATVVVKIAYF
jgi:type 1 fimbria pilin